MKKIGFIGAYDKTDLILYVAKMLSLLGYKILIIDSSINQKAKYVVPVLEPTTSYITEFEGIDVAVGFTDFISMKNYLGIPEKSELKYDISLIDIDSIETFNNFDIKMAEHNFFVTSFDLFSLKKGLEIISGLKEKTVITKILFTNIELLPDDDYINFLSRLYSVVWKEEKILFPIDKGDLLVIIENQRTAKIKIKNLSEEYKFGIELIVETILPKVSQAEINRVLKLIEKGV